MFKLNSLNIALGVAEAEGLPGVSKFRSKEEHVIVYSVRFIRRFMVRRIKFGTPK